MLDQVTTRLADPKPVIVGIVNITPDSFSDGGRYLDADRAVAHGEQLLAEGAEWLDLGAESTRPGAAPIDAEEEWRRLAPVIARLGPQAVCSVDTSKAEVARRALQQGAKLINDVSAGRDQHMFSVVSAARSGLVLMHMRGTPQTMQQTLQPYQDVGREVCDFLATRVGLARAAAVPWIGVDPGLGFGKSFVDNWALVRQLSLFVPLADAVMLGASRKRFLAELMHDRDELTAHVSLLGMLAGVKLHRVHDAKRASAARDVWLRMQGLS